MGSRTLEIRGVRGSATKHHRNSPEGPRSRYHREPPLQFNNLPEDQPQRLQLRGSVFAGERPRNRGPVSTGPDQRTAPARGGPRQRDQGKVRPQSES